METVESKVAKHGHQIETLKESIDHNREDHAKIYERLVKLEKGEATTTTQYTEIIKTLTKMEGDITAMKEKPAKRMDTVIAAGLSAVGGAGGMALLSNIMGG